MYIYFSTIFSPHCSYCKLKQVQILFLCLCRRTVMFSNSKSTKKDSCDQHNTFGEHSKDWAAQWFIYFNFNWNNENTQMRALTCTSLISKLGKSIYKGFPNSVWIKIYLPWTEAGTPCPHNPSHCCLLVVCWLLNVPSTCYCTSGTDPLRQLDVLPHWGQPVQLWPFNARCLAG